MSMFLTELPTISIEMRQDIVASYLNTAQWRSPNFSARKRYILIASNYPFQCLFKMHRIIHERLEVLELFPNVAFLFLVFPDL